MRALVFFLFLALLPSPARAIEYLTKQEALKLAFPDAESADPERGELSAAAAAKVDSIWGKKSDAHSYKVYVGKRKGGAIDGYALFLTRGTKYQPITFLVKISSAGKVDMVTVVTYREPRGEEVKEPRFLKQFFGKTSKDKVELGRDIIAVAGATVSAEVMTMGVKEALVVVDDLFLSKLASNAP